MSNQETPRTDAHFRPRPEAGYKPTLRSAEDFAAQLECELWDMHKAALDYAESSDHWHQKYLEATRQKEEPK